MGECAVKCPAKSKEDSSDNQHVNAGRRFQTKPSKENFLTLGRLGVSVAILLYSITWVGKIKMMSCSL